jgi:DNA-directed RNA polymerase subunit RPC12/RpoP
VADNFNLKKRSENMFLLQEFKCPCCDGAIEFDSSSQKMKCPYCDTEFDVADLQAYADSLNGAIEDNMQWNAMAGGEWQDDETEGMRVYSCNTCGGEIVADETTGATECPFCGNPVVMKEHFAGALKPDLVIPFKLDKKAAMEALKKHYSGKRLLPKVFKDENRIKEVKGLYVPFWLFGADANGLVRYKATRTRIWSDSRYNYTETSHFNIVRAGGIGFENVPVDGSTKMDDTLMESIEPFDISAAVDFKTAYLSGFLADKYDVDAESSIERANERIRRSTEQAFSSTVMGYNTVIPISTNINLNNGNAKYALYPVWILNTQWNGQKYTFAMNGQTGKFVGDLPVDKKAYRKWLFGLWGLVSAGVFLLTYLMWLL